MQPDQETTLLLQEMEPAPFPSMNLDQSSLFLYTCTSHNVHIHDTQWYLHTIQVTTTLYTVLFMV